MDADQHSSGEVSEFPAESEESALSELEVERLNYRKYVKNSELRCQLKNSNLGEFSEEVVDGKPPVNDS